MTEKQRKYMRDYYREKRRKDGAYADYMREYMREYRANNPDFVAREREYNRNYYWRRNNGNKVY